MSESMARTGSCAASISLGVPHRLRGLPVYLSEEPGLGFRGEREDWDPSVTFQGSPIDLVRRSSFRRSTAKPLLFTKLQISWILPHQTDENVDAFFTQKWHLKIGTDIVLHLFLWLVHI